MNPINIDYSSICVHIPHVIQSLSAPHVQGTISLKEVIDAFRVNQMQCKAWLLQQLNDIDRSAKVLVIGSWLGFTSYCLFKMGFSNITETDIDHRLTNISTQVNMLNPNFLHLQKDVNDLDLSLYDLIINTACEHIDNNQWFDNIKSGSTVALQSTNLVWHDHVNTVNSIQEFKNQYSLNYQFTDELIFSPVFSRYMIVGKKL